MSSSRDDGCASGCGCLALWFGWPLGMAFLEFVRNSPEFGIPILAVVGAIVWSWFRQEAPPLPPPPVPAPRVTPPPNPNAPPAPRQAPSSRPPRKVPLRFQEDPSPRIDGVTGQPLRPGEDTARCPACKLEFGAASVAFLESDNQGRCFCSASVGQFRASRREAPRPAVGRGQIRFRDLSRVPPPPAAVEPARVEVTGSPPPEDRPREPFPPCPRSETPSAEAWATMEARLRRTREERPPPPPLEVPRVRVHSVDLETVGAYVGQVVEFRGQVLQVQHSGPARVFAVKFQTGRWVDAFKLMVDGDVAGRFPCGVAGLRGLRGRRVRVRGRVERSAERGLFVRVAEPNQILVL